jgi:hypothetical protein
MPQILRYLIELHDPYATVLCDLADTHERTHQQQTLWIVKRFLEDVMKAQDDSLDTYLEGPQRPKPQEVTDA